MVYGFYISGDVSVVTTNAWLLYKDYAGTINFNITAGDGQKSVIFKVRNPAGKESNSITKYIRLRTSAPSFDYNIDPSICNADSTPTVCHTYETVIPLQINAEEDAIEMYISGNLDSAHPVYGANVDTWIVTDTSKIVAVTNSLGPKNIFVKVRDVFGHEASEILKQLEVFERPDEG